MIRREKKSPGGWMNFGTRRSGIVSSLVFTILLTLARTAIRPIAACADSGARTVEYAETDIIPIHAKIRFSTLIVLPANEEILDATTGDKEFWIINGAHNLCYLHPAQQGIRSNLNLITSTGHVYSFLLTEISRDPMAKPDLKVFVERKKESAIAASRVPPLVRASELEAYQTAVDAARAEAAEAVQAAEDRAQREISRYREQYAGKLQFDYAYDGKASSPPFSILAIYHDDKFTYIKCNAQEKPTIYEVKDGRPNLINFELADGVYVVPKILGNGYLALGKKRLTFERHGV
jgi:type IV secretory pathway VirB9-like protein